MQSVIGLHRIAALAGTAEGGGEAGGDAMTTRFDRAPGTWHLACGFWIAASALPLFAVALAALPGGPAAQGVPGEKYALLIGVRSYAKTELRNLPYSEADVDGLADVLRGAGYRPENVVLLTQTKGAEETRFLPLAANVRRELANLLRDRTEHDSVLVALAGHGVQFRGSDESYFCPADARLADKSTLIPFGELYGELAKCSAGFKLLLADACRDDPQAGGTRGRPEVNLESVTRPQKSVPPGGVAALYSCSAGERAFEDDELRHGVFFHFVIEALRGGADLDGDGRITLPELELFTKKRVADFVRARYDGVRQMPDLVGSTQGLVPLAAVDRGTAPPPFRLRTQSLKDALAALAGELARSIEARGMRQVAVLEFANDTRLGPRLGADFGLLGRWCGDELADRLREIAADRFRVVAHDRVHAALDRQELQVDALDVPGTLKRFAHDAGGVSAVALGTLYGRFGRVVNLDCKLVDPETDDVAGSADVTAALSESEWAMLGRSVQVRPDDRRPDPPSPDRPNRPLADQLIQRLDLRAQGPHPLLDQAFPFPVRVKIGGRAREFVIEDNDAFVPVREGEEYEIEVENRSGQPVCMRLLVDGLNTLPERGRGAGEFIVGKRVDLDDARHWVLDPAVSQLFAVRGFVRETGSQGREAAFTVSRAEQSLAARRQFTDQIGMITAAFYAPRSGARGRLGTAAGRELRQNLAERGGIELGNLLAVVHLRYADADELTARSR